MRLSACVVVKNEAVTLRATLDSLRGHADEMLVVDGGSTDGSQEIARAAGARVLFDAGNITTARNRALRDAREDFRVMIDADEIVDEKTWDSLWAFVRDGKHSLGRILQVSETERGTASLWVTRACTRDLRFHYEGAVHEQLVGKGSCGNTGLTVLHSGYTAEAFARKGAIERNLSLLELEVRVRPDDAYVNYQLGKTLLVAKRASEAVPHLRRALDRLPLDAAYASELGCDLGYALRHAGHLAEALAIARRFQARFPDYTDLHFLEGICHMHLGNAAETRAAFERCVALGEAPRYATVQGVGTYRAHYNLGLFFEFAGDVNVARHHYERALVSGSAFPLARDRLSRLGRAPG
jgi:tetratricopeptide (TPR) repeat protein